MLATGLVLLAGESYLTLGMFLWVVILGWVCLLAQTSSLGKGTKNLILFALLALQLLPLFYFKYWTFVLNDIFGLNLKSPSVLIPMGLSFYTFQTIGFWVDNLRQPQSRPTFIDYLNFSSFFPQIVAGPIERRESLLPQISNCQYRIHTENLKPALQWIILGFAYKLIVADNLGALSDLYRIDPGNAWHVWLECLVFGLRIYFDFGGYSFIAVGLGLLFGVHLTLNFRCPYLAKDLREFWRNWHVTLGAWLREYIYVPLGGNRVKWWVVNTLIVFVVSGIWHGAGWGFLIWGLLHGVGVAVCGLRPGFLRFAGLRWAITFTYVTVAWLFFLERDPTILRAKFWSISTPSSYSPGNFSRFGEAFSGTTNALTTGFILALACGALILEAWGVRKGHEPYHIARYPAFLLGLVFLIVLLAPMEESSFIYFNF